MVDFRERLRLSATLPHCQHYRGRPEEYQYTLSVIELIGGGKESSRSRVVIFLRCVLSRSAERGAVGGSRIGYELIQHLGELDNSYQESTELVPKNNDRRRRFPVRNE